MTLRLRYELRRSPDWVVWRGEEPDERQFYLIKEVALGSPYADQLAGTLEDEYQFLRRFEHPNILRAVSHSSAQRRAAVFATGWIGTGR